MNHKGLIDALKSSYRPPPHEYNEGYVTLHQQWLSLLTVRSTQFPTLIGYLPKIWYFVCNLRVNLGQNQTI